LLSGLVLHLKTLFLALLLELFVGLVVGSGGISVSSLNLEVSSIWDETCF
jgi:hypothetical protein